MSIKPCNTNPCNAPAESPRKSFPHLPLLAPARCSGDQPEVLFCDSILSPFCRRQEQDLLLQVGRKVKQVHDLRQAGPAHVAKAGQLGLIGHRAIADQLIEPDRQGHQPRYPRDAAARLDQLRLPMARIWSTTNRSISPAGTEGDGQVCLPRCWAWVQT
jgi:hypothetical protein